MNAATWHSVAEEAYSPVDSRRWNDIWTAPWVDITGLELIPGYPMQADIWVIPPNWASGGAAKRLCGRTVRFATALGDGWDRNDLQSELAIRRLKRIAVLMFLRTVRVGRVFKDPATPSTWVKHVNGLANSARTALMIGGHAKSKFPSTCPDGPPIFRDLSSADFNQVRAENKNFAHAVISRLNGLFGGGAFDDWPASDVGVFRYAKTSGYEPFNDEFTSAMCAAALWVVEVLGPDLLECWVGLQALNHLGGRNVKTNKLRNDFVASWSGRTLCPGFRYRYLFQLKSHNDEVIISEEFATWPPRGRAGLRGMLGCLQEATAVLINLAIGPRDGEATDLPRDCVRELHDGDILLGHTFKLSEEPGGEPRQWPLPKTVVQAIFQQQKLAELMDPGGKYLFVPFATYKSIEDGKRSYLPLKSFAEKTKFLDGQSLSSVCQGSVHSHRFRKTVARLAALSLVGANQILFDILGHRDAEMTLNYILSDPQLQDEIREIAREACVAMATSALRDPSKNGGPAAIRVDEFAKRLIPRSGPDELEIESLKRAAEILSQGGRVMLVKRGILCTKTFNQAGPCTQRAGNPDIGNCATDCLHRLELEAAKADHLGAIDLILNEIPGEGHFMRPWWQAQLVSHLLPFSDIRSEMLLDPKVRSALTGASPAVINDLLDSSSHPVVKDLLEVME